MPKQYCYAMVTPQQAGTIILNVNLNMVLFKFGDTDDFNHDLQAYQTYNPSYYSRNRDVGTGRPAGTKYGPPGGTQYDNVGTWLKNVVFANRNFEKVGLQDSNAQEWFKVYIGPNKGDSGTIGRFVSEWETATPLNTWPQQQALLNNLIANIFPPGAATAA